MLVHKVNEWVESGKSSFQLHVSDFTQMLAGDMNETQVLIRELLILAGLGKIKEPLVSYDPDIIKFLNRRDYFSNVYGPTLRKPEVISNLTKKFKEWGCGTLTFVYEYNLNVTLPPMFWHMTFIKTKEDMMDVHVFGSHTYGYRDLIFELYNVMTIWRYVTHMFSDWVLSTGTMTVTLMLEHELGAWQAPVEEQMIRDVDGEMLVFPIPTPAELQEIMRLEEVIRMNRPAIKPSFTVLLDPAYEEIVNHIFHYWKGSGGAK